MRVEDILCNVTVKGDRVISPETGNEYSIAEYCNLLKGKYKLSKEQYRQVYKQMSDCVKEQSDKSRVVEELINKYELEFSDGVYFIHGEVCTLDELYKVMWRNEKLIPDEVNDLIDTVEKVSEPKNLQQKLFVKILEKERDGKSEYLASLDRIYPNNTFRNLLYNVLVPNSNTYFNILYDDGVGGTGKSTLLEVITMIVGENLVSNVLLDQFSNRFIFSNMLGKYVNIGDDNGKNDELANVGTLKSIVTGNRVTIDRKNMQPIEVRIFAKQIFATNILPYIDFTDGGLMRRLNITSMNHVIPNTEQLPVFDEQELGAIIHEALQAGDIKHNDNHFAITNNPLYLFYGTETDRSYNSYKNFCYNNGFKALNLINFNVKSKFVLSYREQHKCLEPIKDEETPF